MCLSNISKEDTHIFHKFFVMTKEVFGSKKQDTEAKHTRTQEKVHSI